MYAVRADITTLYTSLLVCGCEHSVTAVLVHQKVFVMHTRMLPSLPFLL